MLTALSKDKVSTIALSVRREQSKRGNQGGTLQAKGKYSEFPSISAISTPKSGQSHVPDTLQRGSMLDIWNRSEGRDSTGSIPQGTHLPRMPNLCHPVWTHLCPSPAPWGRRPAGCRAPLPPPISARLCRCVDAEQGHIRQRRKQLSLQTNPSPPTQSSFQCSSPP